MHKWDSRQRKGTAKKPKLFGEASALLPWLGLNSRQEAVRASVTHRGRQWQPDVPRQVEQPGPGPQGAQQAWPPTTLNTQDDGTGPRCSTNNSPIRETWIQILCVYAEFTVTCGQDLDQPLVHVGWHRYFRPQISQQLGWWQRASPRTQHWNSSRQLQLQPFHFLKYSLTAVPIHKADVAAFQQENYDLNPWISILPDQVNSEVHWFHFFSFLNKILAVHTCGNKSSPNQTN